MSKTVVDYEEVWEEVNSPDFANVPPTNEHDRHSVKGMVALMMETRAVINNPEQWGVYQA